jgi:hypothetical protein
MAGGDHLPGRGGRAAPTYRLSVSVQEPGELRTQQILWIKLGVVVFSAVVFVPYALYSAPRLGQIGAGNQA